MFPAPLLWVIFCSFRSSLMKAPVFVLSMPRSLRDRDIISRMGRKASKRRLSGGDFCSQKRDGAESAVPFIMENGMDAAGLGSVLTC